VKSNQICKEGKQQRREIDIDFGFAVLLLLLSSQMTD